MTITGWRTALLAPTSTAITAPRFSISTVNNVGVWLEDDAGNEGFAYGYVFDPHTGQAVQHLIEAFADAYVGADVTELRKVRSQLLTTKVNFLGVRGLARLAACVLDMAAWDLLCRTRSTNLPGLVGAERWELPALGASGLWAGLPPDECAKVAVKATKELGTPHNKMWIGSKDLGFETERIIATREALGPDGSLVVDAAQAYDWRTAARLAQGLEGIDILWFEDPVEYEDNAGLQAFAAEAPMDVGSGEHIYGLDQLKQVLDLGALKYVVLDLERIGGVTDFLAAAALCEAYRVEVASHCYPHLSAQVLCTARTGSWCELAPLWDHFFGAPDVVDGVIRVDPSTVGLGIDPTSLELVAP